MRYAYINPADMKSGDGVNVSLWVSGCPHMCKGCHNPELWDREYGERFTPAEEGYIIELLQGGMKKDLSILGGEPLADYNYDAVLHLCKMVKNHLFDVRINIWTGYYYDELVDLGKGEILQYIDMLVDGRYEEENHIDGRYYGSTNQRVHVFG